MVYIASFKDMNLGKQHTVGRPLRFITRHCITPDEKGVCRYKLCKYYRHWTKIKNNKVHKDVNIFQIKGCFKLHVVAFVTKPYLGLILLL